MYEGQLKASVGTFNNCPPVGGDSSEIQREHESLKAALEKLESCFSTLATRLYPVRAQGPVGEDCGEAKIDPRAPLADSLRQDCYHVERMTRAVNEVLNDLAL
jgi:hypothetical protein